MKRIVITLLLSLTAIMGYSQETIKFLGIPVDGTASNMTFKIRQKGFKQVGDHLEGVFNGKQVNVFVHENNGKVDRVMVGYQTLYNKAGIKREFNALREQFERNDKYLPVSSDPIPDDEDIAYEMTVHDKEYGCSYALSPFELDADGKFSEYARDLVARSTAEVEELIAEGSVKEEDKQSRVTIRAITNAILESTGSVWFTILEAYGEYYIAIFYDNENNRPNGEDL